MGDQDRQLFYLREQAIQRVQRNGHFNTNRYSEA